MSVSEVRNRLTLDLRAAMKSRDSATVATLRSLLGAIDNASAVTLSADHQPTVGRSSDVARRSLTSEDLEAILTSERNERLHAIGEYTRMGRSEEVAKLQTEVTLITHYLSRSD